jgi:hypothetical protein
MVDESATGSANFWSFWAAARTSRRSCCRSGGVSETPGHLTGLPALAERLCLPRNHESGRSDVHPLAAERVQLETYGAQLVGRPRAACKEDLRSGAARLFRSRNRVLALRTHAKRVLM